jgi:GNAT superfamily N-acetyltransferase
MKIVEVREKETIKKFHKVASEIYEGDSKWVTPLELLVDSTFDPSKNVFYENGDGTRWFLEDGNGKLLGRIAAFIDGHKAHTFEQPTGGVGYFECVDNKDAAFMLFDTAKEWLTERGMEAMDGPVNFGENMINWGLLVDGFVQQGFGMPYNKPYYLRFFEEYGFKVYFEQYSYHIDRNKPMPERFWKIAEWVAKKPNFRFEHVRLSESAKYIRDFAEIHEKAWAKHDNYQPIDIGDVSKMINAIKHVIDEEFVWFAYHNDEPVAFFGMIPDLNQILIKLNGKLNLLSILKFFYYKFIKTITRARILIMGVVPKYQGAGLESAIFWHIDKILKRKPWYKEVEISWAGDFNPKMIAMYKSVGGVHAKTHYTMRYLFDRDKPFERAPMLMNDVRVSREEMRNLKNKERVIG